MTAKDWKLATSRLAGFMTKDWTQIVQDFKFFNFFSRGIDVLKKWCDLPAILQNDRKKVLPSPGKGLCLIESIITCLMEDYDIQIDYNKMVEFIATEICRNPDYTRYMKTPLTQGEVNYSLMAMSENTKYSRLVAELYLPALATALDLHLRVIQNIGGYYGVMNTLPLPNERNTKQKKTITLILIDGTYYPVVQASTTDLPTTTYTTIKTGSPAQYPVNVMEEEASPQVLVPETQLDNTPNSPPAITHSPIVIPESPYATPHTPAVIPESPVLTISPVKPEPQVTRGIKRRRLSQTSRNWRTSAQGNAEELIIISSDSETDGDASPVFLGAILKHPNLTSPVPMKRTLRDNSK